MAAEIRVAVPECLAPYAEMAIVRLQYLHSSWSIERCGGEVVVYSDATLPGDVRSEVTYTLYRERIYRETLSLRRDLIEAVTRP
jgi:hypothetical protein